VKINANVDVIERGGVSEGRSFSLNFNEKIARMLSKGIYQNVIRAPIRELACNALDSHRAAHKRDVPIRVHLPNNLEPYFEVQDEGVGLSDEGIYNLFTCYGGSNKDHSNEAIGGFGLGSKAPFAYTNTFTVTSVYEGIKRHYVMHKDEMGKPHVTPMGHGATPECNGVTVQVPVKPTDFEAFRENAQETFRWFELAPIVSGNSRYSLPKLTFVSGFEHSQWSLYQADNDYYNRGQAVVVMADVAYPLRADSLNDKYKRLSKYPIIIRVQNGELEPAVSREDLNYDEQTVQVLETYLSGIMLGLKHSVESRISTANTMWQARVALLQLKNDRTTSDILTMLGQAGYTPTWQSQPVPSSGYIDWGTTFNKENPLPSITIVSEFYRGRHTKDIQVGAQTQFVLMDCSDAVSRCREAFYHNQSSKRVYLIEGVSQDTVTGHKIWNATRCDQVALMLQEMGHPDTILASSLDKPQKKVMTFKGRIWTGNGNTYYKSNKSANWKQEEQLTTAQGGYYVTMEGLTPKKGDLELDLTTMLSCAKDLGILPLGTRVWGINKTNTKLIEKNPAWVEIHAHITKHIQQLIQRNNLAQAIHDRDQTNEANGRVCGGVEEWIKAVGHMTNGLGVYVREWSRMAKNVNSQIDTNVLRKLSRAVGVQIDSTTVANPVDLTPLWTQVLNTYPLIRYAVRMYPTGAEFQMFMDYINLVDTSKN